VQLTFPISAGRIKHQWRGMRHLEPDIDIPRPLGAHAILEVVTIAFITQPYRPFQVIRTAMGSPAQHAGVRSFNRYFTDAYRCDCQKAMRSPAASPYPDEEGAKLKRRVRAIDPLEPLINASGESQQRVEHARGKFLGVTFVSNRPGCEIPSEF